VKPASPRPESASSSGVSSFSGRHWLIVLGAYFALALIMTHPLFMRMSDHVLITPIDNLHLTWVLSWDYHALGSTPLKLFDANIFYPDKNSLALSEHLLGDLPVFAPVMFLTQNPILAANSVVFGSFVLCGISMFALAWYWTRSLPASFVAGFIYAFSPPRIGQLGKWHLLSVQWAPLALLFLEKFLRSRRWRDGLLASGFFALQVLSSFYMGYALILVIGSYVVYRFVTDRSLRGRPLMFRGIVCAALAAMITLAPAYPYVAAKRDLGLAPPDPMSYAWASTDPALSFLSVTIYGKNVYQPLLERFQSAAPWESWLFPGVLPVLLAAVAVCSVSQVLQPLPAARWDRRTVGACLLILAVPLVISLGPVLVIDERVTGIPMPYTALWHLVPGFSMLRAPARFALMAWVGLSLLAGCGAQVFARAVTNRMGASVHRRLAEVGLAGVLVLLLMVEFWFVPLPMDPIETGRKVPPVYRWLASQSRQGAVLEVPWTTRHDRQIDSEWRKRYWLLDHDIEWTRGQQGLLFDWITRARYVYFSVYHWHPVVGGYTSYPPPGYEAIVARLRGFPSAESVEFLGAIGVRWLVVHRTLLESGDAGRWRTLDQSAIGLNRAHEFDGDVVYEIVGSARHAVIKNNHR
jgi:hypothetical protein